MSLLTYGANDLPIAMRPQSQAAQVTAAFSPKTLLEQCLRLILVVAVFAALVAAIIGVRVAVWLPAIPH